MQRELLTTVTKIAPKKKLTNIRTIHNTLKLKLAEFTGSRTFTGNSDNDFANQVSKFTKATWDHPLANSHNYFTTAQKYLAWKSNVDSDIVIFENHGKYLASVLFSATTSIFFLAYLNSIDVFVVSLVFSPLVLLFGGLAIEENKTTLFAASRRNMQSQHKFTKQLIDSTDEYYKKKAK